jgi:hypothetical protein
MRLAILLTLATALTPALATAAPAASASEDADAAALRATSPGGTKVFIYDDEDIDGESLKPDHMRVDYRPPGKHPSLIKVRAHFIPEMLRMATDV